MHLEKYVLPNCACYSGVQRSIKCNFLTFRQQCTLHGAVIFYPVELNLTRQDRRKMTGNPITPAAHNGIQCHTGAVCVVCYLLRKVSQRGTVLRRGRRNMRGTSREREGNGRWIWPITLEKGRVQSARLNNFHVSWIYNTHFCNLIKRT